MAGEAVVSPEVMARVAKKDGESSEILKQQRKALEAGGLAAPKDKAK